MYDAVRGAQREVILTIPGESALTRNSPDVEAVHDMGDRGTRVHVFVPPGADGPGTAQGRELARLAARQVRISRTPQATTRMALIDRRSLVVAENERDYEDGGMVGRQLPFIGMIAGSLVSGVLPSGDPRETGGAPWHLEPRTQEVLRQLAHGATDEAAARELGMALRTYRRVVCRIMTRLQARSRFQAGIMVARRDWVS
ncbi:helix-turn-helix transcriptional regulator [Streptomyces mutabilis]|uniref:helix-turn-helix transcriptional regulator n=1 Tax=Streptomyces mutabilis TaxID=67332 RepID=UPI0036774D02